MPAATSSGTVPTGRQKSIGTNTTWVGTVKPWPTAKRIRDASA